MESFYISNQINGNFCRKNVENIRNLKKKMLDTPDNVSLIAFAYFTIAINT